MKRYWEIDALRGLMLVLMTFTHLPTRFTDPLGQPFGFVSAAEGFVLLSAFVAGLVYTRISDRRGVDAMRRAFWRRALKVYLAQAATLLFLFTIITRVGLHIDQTAVKNLLAFYLAHPLEGFGYSLLLVYEPALLDILPMYIFFMLMSPWVLAFALRQGWTVVMVASAVLWGLAQFGFSEWLYGLAVHYLHLPVPFRELGAFNAFAWQFLWFAGLWMGASRHEPHGRSEGEYRSRRRRFLSEPDAEPFRFPKWLVALAAGTALYGLWWRHHGINGQAPFGGDETMNLLFDKWQLGPLRIVNLVVLGIVAVRFGPWLMRRIPRPHRLEAMGSASLPVFCAHLVAVLLVLAFYGDSQTARPWWGDVLLLGVVFAWLYGVARAALWWSGWRRSRGDYRNVGAIDSSV